MISWRFHSPHSIYKPPLNANYRSANQAELAWSRPTLQHLLSGLTNKTLSRTLRDDLSRQRASASSGRSEARLAVKRASEEKVDEFSSSVRVHKQQNGFIN